MSLVALIHVRHPWQASSIIHLAHQEEIIEMVIEVQLMVDIPIDLVDMVVIMAPNIMLMVVSLMILMEVALIVLTQYERWHRQDWHSQQHDQFQQSMITMNNSLIDQLHCQQRTQDDTTYALEVIYHCQKDHVNDSLIDVIFTFDWKPEIYLTGP